MSSSRRPKTKNIDINRLFSLMDRWAKSWAGIPESLPICEGLVAEFRPFIQYLAQCGLSPKTVRNHMDNTWEIGGEIIRRLERDDPPYMKQNPRQLLLEEIDLGEAPLVHGCSEREQRALDATAKKLFRFLNATPL